MPGAARRRSGSMQGSRTAACRRGFAAKSWRRCRCGWLQNGMIGWTCCKVRAWRTRSSAPEIRRSRREIPSQSPARIVPTRKLQPRGSTRHTGRRARPQHPRLVASLSLGEIQTMVVEGCRRPQYPQLVRRRRRQSRQSRRLRLRPGGQLGRPLQQRRLGDDESAKDQSLVFGHATASRKEKE